MDQYSNFLKFNKPQLGYDWGKKEWTCGESRAPEFEEALEREAFRFFGRYFSYAAGWYRGARVVVVHNALAPDMRFLYSPVPAGGLSPDYAHCPFLVYEGCCRDYVRRVWAGDGDLQVDGEFRPWEYGLTIRKILGTDSLKDL
jgi:hypothetical protein